MHITVLGSGGWGTALAVMLCENGHDVTLWSHRAEESAALARDREHKKHLPGVTLPETLRLTADLSCAACDFMINATPSFGLMPTLSKAAVYIPRDATVVNVSKGILLTDDGYHCMSDVIETLLPGRRVVAVTGPSHAEEVGRGIPTAVLAASKVRESAELVQEVMMNERFRVYTTPDLIGAELGGALKNVIALAAGITDGLGLGDNTKAALMTRGLTEMARLGVAMGGYSSTFAGLSGIGDLIVTCTSMHSRNRRAGILIGKGYTAEAAIKEVGATVEGYYAAKAAHEWSMGANVEMPIVDAVYAVLYGGANPAESIRMLMSRGKKHETEETWMRDIRWEA